LLVVVQTTIRKWKSAQNSLLHPLRSGTFGHHISKAVYLYSKEVRKSQPDFDENIKKRFGIAKEEIINFNSNPDS